MIRVLQISADRSARGLLHPGTAAFARQEAYAQRFGHLDIVAFSRRSDGAKKIDAGALRIYPTNSRSSLLYALDASRLARTLPRPDVVTAQDPFETGLTAWWIARRLNASLHIQVHTDFLSPAYARLSLKNRLRVWTAGFVLRRAVGIRTVSQKIKGSIEMKYQLHLEPSISVLPIFFLAQRFRVVGEGRSSELEERFRRFVHKLVVISRLEPEKNVALAIRSFQTAAPTTACLIIVGDGSERQALEKLRNDLGLTDRVFFEGEQNATPYEAFADLVLAPSLYEGFGLVIAEALEAHKPVISMPVGAAREMGAILAADADSFADEVKRWFINGPRTASLNLYMYQNFDDYIRAYCGDIIACAQVKKT